MTQQTRHTHTAPGCAESDGPTGMMHALLREIADALERFVTTGEVTAIDMRGLPLSDADRIGIEQQLGQGEVSAILTVAGQSEIWETAISGVWWVRHLGASGGVAAEEIVITRLPEILATHPDDARDGLVRLRAMLAAPTADTTSPHIATTEDAA